MSPSPTLRSTHGLLSILPNHGLACLPAPAPSDPNCRCSPGCCPWLTHQPCCFSWPGAWSGQPEWPHQPRSRCTRWGKGEGKSEWPRAVATKALLWLSQVYDSNQFEKTRHQVTKQQNPECCPWYPVLIPTLPLGPRPLLVLEKTKALPVIPLCGLVPRNSISFPRGEAPRLFLVHSFYFDYTCLFAKLPGPAWFPTLCFLSACNLLHPPSVPVEA